MPGLRLRYRPGPNRTLFYFRSDTSTSGTRIPYGLYDSRCTLLYLKGLFSSSKTTNNHLLVTTLYDIKEQLSTVHSQTLHNDGITKQASMKAISDQLSHIIDFINIPLGISDIKQPFEKIVTIIRTTLLVVTISFILSAGILDVYYTARVDLHKFTMYSQEELELSEWVKNKTPVDSKWLVSTKHNHWLFNLTGRQEIITYIGWLWSHGYNYYPTEQDMLKIYKTANNQLIKQYGIQYIVIDSHARNEMGANEALFRGKFPILKETNNYVIFITEK